MKTIKYIIIAVLILLVGLGITTYILLSSKINSEKNIVLTVKPGMDISTATEQLFQQNILQPAILYKIIIHSYAKQNNSKLLVGTHVFDKNITNLELIKQFLNNTALLRKKVTFPEGITIKRFATILHNTLNIDSAEFVNMCNDSAVCRQLGVNANSLEGYLQPNTYYFGETEGINNIIKILVKHQLPEIEQVTNNLNLHEIITLASIVEAETPTIEERKRVSGVYHNRLQMGMALCADPTVQYALGEQKRRLFYSDLEVDSPYNTYKYKGLPPGPINSPSQSSIEAALKPEAHNYLYFVAKGDGSGTHYFAANYSEHQKNVLKYKAERQKKEK